MSGVLERVVENWLNKINELGYQLPFCQLLTGEGHQVIHLSRHGSYEEGKDVIALAPDGTPCAYQLKGGNITLKVWADIADQVTRLVEVPIIHPSFDFAENKRRRVFLVTNGVLDEETRIEIDHRNREWELRGLPKLETVVRWQLLRRFIDLHMNLSPITLQSEKMLLEFFLANGKAGIDKAQLSNFILSILPVDTSPNKAACERALASAAVLLAYCISPHAEEQNYVAVIEGWTVYVACVALIAEKHKLSRSYWNTALVIAETAIEQAFERLCAELKERTHLVEGDALVDGYFYKGRVTWLVGLVSAFALWSQLRANDWADINWAKQFVIKNRNQIQLWGEAASPQILSTIWFLRTILSTPEPDFLLRDLIRVLCRANGYSDDNATLGIPPPYKDLSSFVAEQTKLSLSSSQETYKGRSYSLESLIYLFARRNWRQEMKKIWYDITFVDFSEFVPDQVWQYCLWHSADGGRLIEKQPNTPQSWTMLRDQAEIVDTFRIPTIFRDNPQLLLLFLIVYPHRLNPNFAIFLDTKLH